MRYVTTTTLVLGLLALTGLPGRARADVLANDGYVPAGGAAFPAGFVSGEVAGARFTPSGPAELTAVRLLFGGSTSTRDVILHVWADSGAADPLIELYSGTWSITGADDSLSELDLSGLGVHVDGPFRVGIEFTADGVPSVANDTDGTIAVADNFIRTTPIGWVRSNSLGLTGDWVIRAVLTPDLDAGVSVDAAVEDAAAVDASPSIDADLLVDLSAPRDASGDVDASGAECRSNTECASGQYCSAAGTCTFDCRANSDCAGGATCNSLGRCVAPPPESGCGCRVGSPGHGAPALSVLALVLLLARRRLQRAKLRAR